MLKTPTRTPDKSEVGEGIWDRIDCMHMPYATSYPGTPHLPTKIIPPKIV